MFSFNFSSFLSFHFDILIHFIKYAYFAAFLFVSLNSIWVTGLFKAILFICYGSRAYYCSCRIIIIIYSLEFFTSALADGLSLEIEWQQVSPSLQDSSQYSSRLQ